MAHRIDAVLMTGALMLAAAAIVTPALIILPKRSVREGICSNCV